jgi:hypothetical protein
VSDEEVVGEEPDVSFDASAAPVEGVIEGDAAPVVIVGVACYGGDVAGDFEEVGGESPGFDGGGVGPEAEEEVKYRE